MLACNAPYIRPIETRYNGYLFRSRLEARWAVFFDKMGIEYDYEREGYDLKECRRYLPDFWLPEYGWVEIKGVEPEFDSIEMKKCSLLAELTHTNVYLFYGAMKLPTDSVYPSPMPAYVDFGDGGGDWPYNWCQCYCGKKLGIEFDGRSGRLGCSCTHGDDRMCNIDSPDLMNAFETAMSYRF